MIIMDSVGNRNLIDTNLKKFTHENRVLMQRSTNNVPNEYKYHAVFELRRTGAKFARKDITIRRVG